MNKSEMAAKLDYFNMVHGVTLRAIATFSDEELNFRPKPAMRTPKELIFHIYTQEKVIADVVRQGRFTMDDANRSNPESEAVAAELKALATVAHVQAYADACHQLAAKTLGAMSEEDMNRTVESQFGT